MSIDTDALRVPEIQLKVAIRRAAQEQYGRHVANRLCLAILADNRTPLGAGQLTFTHSTRGRDQAPSKKAGTSSTPRWNRCSCSTASGRS